MTKRNDGIAMGGMQMNIKIYQINTQRDMNLVKFLHYEHLDSFQETKDINASIYDEVFSGEV